MSSGDKKKVTVVAVKLELTPTKHVRDKERIDKHRLDVQRFQGFRQTLASQQSRRSGLMISFRQGRGSIFLLVRGKADTSELLQTELLSKAKAFLTEFRVSPVEIPTDEEEGESHSILVRGVPELRENPVEPLARYFLENGYDGDYEVIMEHTSVNPLSRLFTYWR